MSEGDDPPLHARYYSNCAASMTRAEEEERSQKRAWRHATRLSLSIFLGSRHSIRLYTLSSSSFDSQFPRATAPSSASHSSPQQTSTSYLYTPTGYLCTQPRCVLMLHQHYDIYIHIAVSIYFRLFEKHRFFYIREAENSKKNYIHPWGSSFFTYFISIAQPGSAERGGKCRQVVGRCLLLIALASWRRQSIYGLVVPVVSSVIKFRAESLLLRLLILTTGVYDMPLVI